MMNTVVTDPAIQAVREAIESDMQRRGIETQADLAKAHGVYPKHISRWYNGRFTRLDRILITILLSSRSPETP